MYVRLCKCVFVSVDGWMDGWMDGCVCVSVYDCVCNCVCKRIIVCVIVLVFYIYVPFLFVFCQFIFYTHVLTLTSILFLYMRTVF